MTPHGVQRKRTNGWRMPPNTVNVARPSRWGNPFRAGDWVGYTAAHAVRDYTRWIGGDLSYISAGIPPTRAEIRRELGGKNLACWCGLDAPCHRNPLLKIANPKRRRR